MLRLTYASVGDIEGVEIRLVGVRVRTVAQTQEDMVQLLSLLLGSTRKVGQAIARKSRVGREGETPPTRVRGAGDTP